MGLPFEAEMWTARTSRLHGAARHLLSRALSCSSQSRASNHVVPATMLLAGVGSFAGYQASAEAEEVGPPEWSEGGKQHTLFKKTVSLGKGSTGEVFLAETNSEIPLCKDVSPASPYALCKWRQEAVADNMFR